MSARTKSVDWKDPTRMGLIIGWLNTLNIGITGGVPEQL